MRSCLVIWVLFISCIGVYTEGSWMPDTFTTHQHPSADTGDNLDEDDGSSLIVSRGNDVLTSTETQTGHYREITATLTAFKETFILDLKLNTYLLASTYIEKAITDSGEVYNDVNHVTGHCYYTGQVRNRSQSTAAISTCKGVSGYFAIGNVAYHIEAEGDNLNGRHRIFRNRDDVKNTFRCGTEGHHTWMSSNNLTEFFGRSIHRMKRSFLYPQDADRKDKVVEVYVANDNSQYRARSSDVKAVYNRTKEIINVASSLFQPLGIYLVLVGVEVWTDSDRFEIRGSNINGALYSWYAYRQNSVNPFHYNDNGVLISSVSFYGKTGPGILGVALRGTMCSNRISGSLISDISDKAAAGVVLAHEMGHNFGLQHDDQLPQCSCDDSVANNFCIMHSVVNGPSTKWSSCSKIQFATSFNQGLDICLYNIPKTIFQPSFTCGNGIVEDGEQCDCGKAPSSECNTTCCNRCQLTASASCASGRCCDISRCQVKSSGTVCRSKSNVCDLSESCNGVDARCPTDSYKPDGTNCKNIESAYCYQGQCRSHQSQCELLWGPGTLASANVCYYKNQCGIRWKNTGFDRISCAVKDEMCGVLQCQGNKKTLYHYPKQYTIGEFEAESTTGEGSCHTIIFDFGIGIQDPGLVPNGAKCGDKQMCVNQKCVNVTVLPPSMSTTTTPKTRSTTSPKKNTGSIIKTSFTPTKSNRSTTMSNAAKEGAFGVHLGQH